MGQTMYNYDFFGRSSTTGANGTPQLSTADDDERLQASLQHVVMTYDPVNGRRIYVNGEFTGDLDGAGGGTLGDWDNSFAFVLGNEVSNNRQWTGVIRLAAIHNRALTLQQVQQNFEAGVGEKFFMLFGISHLVSVPRAYILFEAQQYDSSGYLFNNPKFVSLDATAMPGSIPIRGMRIGVNGAEPSVGQAYRLMDTVITDANYAAATGQTLSTVGTIIGLEQGPTSDEFYLCFDTLGTRSDVCSQYASASPPTFITVPKPSDIGFRTFDKINATMSSVTGVSPNTAAVRSTYTSIRQSLPAVDSIEAFLSSHQTAIAQLAIQYCDALVESPRQLLPGPEPRRRAQHCVRLERRQGSADRPAGRQHDRHEPHDAAERRGAEESVHAVEPGGGRSDASGPLRADRHAQYVQRRLPGKPHEADRESHLRRGARQRRRADRLIFEFRSGMTQPC